MFNQSGGLRTGTTTTSNPMQDFEVVSPPDDSVSSLAFSPASIPQNFLVAGSWDNNVRCWEVEQSGKTVPKSMQSMGGPVLDVCWSHVSIRDSLLQRTVLRTTLRKVMQRYAPRNMLNNILLNRMEQKYLWPPAIKQLNVGI